MTNVKPSELRIVEVGKIASAPFAGKLFVDMGAEVIKIEQPGVGDPKREPTHGAIGMGTFPLCNYGKKSVELNLKHSDGKRVFKELLETTDVLIENLSPGSFSRLGLSLEQLVEENPRLVATSIKAFGKGPKEDRLGTDFPIEVESGMAYMNGLEGKPMRAGFSVLDLTAAIFSVYGMLQILPQRPLPPQERFFTTGLYETAILLLGQSLSYASQMNEPPSPLNTGDSSWTVYDFYETSDRESVFVGLVSDQQYIRFVEELDMEDLLGPDLISDKKTRIENQEEIQQIVAEVIASYPSEEVLEKLKAARVLYAPVYTPLDALNDPQLKEKLITYSDEKRGDAIKVPAPPMDGGFFNFSRDVKLPELGEHTTHYLSEVGYTPEEIRRLRDLGVIGEIEPDGADVGV